MLVFEAGQLALQTCRSCTGTSFGEISVFVAYWSALKLVYAEEYSRRGVGRAARSPGASHGGGLGELARTVYTSHRPPLAPSLLPPPILHYTRPTTPHPLHSSSSSSFVKTSVTLLTLITFGVGCRTPGHHACIAKSTVVDTAGSQNLEPVELQYEVPPDGIR
jgi:hypothetical protein